MDVSEVEVRLVLVCVSDVVVDSDVVEDVRVVCKIARSEGVLQTAHVPAPTVSDVLEVDFVVVSDVLEVLCVVWSRQARRISQKGGSITKVESTCQGTVLITSGPRRNQSLTVSEVEDVVLLVVSDVLEVVCEVFSHQPAEGVSVPATQPASLPINNSPSPKSKTWFGSLFQTCWRCFGKSERRNTVV